MPGPKIFLWLGLAASILVVGLLAYVLRHHAMERWVLLRLDRLGDQEKASAIETLRSHGGSRQASAARGKVIDDLHRSSTTATVPIASLDLDEAALSGKLLEVLERGGLTPEEAGSLLKTWREDFFQKPGLRILTVIPQWMYEVLLPADVYPLPGEFARVGVVWRECDDIEVDAGGTPRPSAPQGRGTSF